MSKSKRDLTTEEKTLWRRVAKSVKPRRPQPHEPEEPVKHAPVVAPKARVVPSTHAPSHKPKPKAVAPPANRGAEKRVRRGQLEIGGRIDLHGHTQDGAQGALLRFLRSAYARDAGTVIVITGVGRGGEGVLKRRFPDWIADPGLRGVISGYAPAHRSHGGAGAFYVFLKRPK